MSTYVKGTWSVVNVGSGGEVNYFVYNNGTYNIPVKLTAPSAEYNVTWEMRLQRYTNGAWQTIGTRTGYVSGISPSERTFTNVTPGTASMRLQTYWPQFGTTRNSSTFKHTV